MKDISLIVWLSQLGLSVVMPIAGFVLLAVYLRQQFSLGVWIIIAGTVLGLICAVQGLRNSLKMMEQMAKNKKEDLPVSFNDHE